MIDVMPKMLDKTAMCSPLFYRGMDIPMIAKAPLKSRLAPKPATARPTISMAELFAAAHSVDPTTVMLIFF